MRRGTLARGLTSAVIVAVGCFWSVWALPNALPTPVSIVAGQAYAVPVVHVKGEETATCDLEFDEGSTYLVCISALGSQARKWPIQIETISDSGTIRSPTAFTLPAASLTPPQKCGPDAPLAVRAKSADESEKKTLPAERNFFLHVTDGPLENAANYVRIHAHLAVQTDGVCIYLDDLQPDDTHTQCFLNETATLLAREILPDLRNRLGDVRDVDGDGHFCVLVSPWLSRLQGGRTHVSGFVRGTDFQTHVPTPYGHSCDMLYLNPDLQNGLDLRTLLAHELTHAVSISQRLRRPGSPTSPATAALPGEEDWLNEAIAHVVENQDGRYWSNLDHRVARFLADPSAAPLVVPDYFRSGRWRDHGCRGATFLFLDWCQQQFGTALLPRLLEAPASGYRNLELATGRSFADLFRGWTISLAQQSPPFQTAENRSLPEHVGRFSLCGPQSEHICLEPTAKWEKTINLQGTTVAFLELRQATSLEKNRRIRIRTEQGTELQVTLLKTQRPTSFNQEIRIAATSAGDGQCNLEVTNLPASWQLQQVTGYQAAGTHFLTQVWKETELTDTGSVNISTPAASSRRSCEFPLTNFQMEENLAAENSAGEISPPVFCVELKGPSAQIVRRWFTIPLTNQLAKQVPTDQIR